jgi:hypothetical protein
MKSPHLLSNRTICNLAGKRIRICPSEEQLGSFSSKFDTEHRLVDHTLANESREEIVGAKDGDLRESEPGEAVGREIVDCKTLGVFIGIPCVEVRE